MVDGEKAYKLSLQGYNAREIADMLGEDYEKVRKRIKYHRKKNGTSRENHGTETIDIGANGFKYNNGIYEYKDEFVSANGEILTVEKALELKGLDVNDWEIISFNTNTWQSGDSNKYQFKLTVKPKKENELTFAEIDKFFADKDFNVKRELPKAELNTTGNVLEIDIADLHCGLLSWRNETGKDEDLKICRDRFLKGMAELIARNKGNKIKDVYLCSLGDIIHIDNDNNTTTKGTIQQADGRIAKIFDFAFDTMNDAIEMLRELKAKIHYVYLCGNHDRNTGYYLVKCLQLANKDVDLDITPNPQKAIHFGKVLVGLSHGDMIKKNKGAWLLNDYRKEYGQSEYVEEHCGHFHTEGLQYINGVLVRNVLAQCGNSFWEHTMAFRSLRGIMAFEWDAKKGLKATQYVYF